MKKISLLFSFAALLVAVGCGKSEETPAPTTTGTASTAPPTTEGGAQRQGGLPAPKLNQGAGSIDNFGSKAGG